MAQTAVENVAKVLKKQILRTNVHHRPFPTLLLFPGITQKPYHNPDDFEFVKDFQANTDVIKKEYQALRKAYGEKDDYIKHDGEHTLNNGEWHWMNYVTKGIKQSEFFKKYCPLTTQILEESVGKHLMTGTPFSYTFFSTMKPKTSIAAHYGATNLKLRCHFPLFVPEESYLRVAGDPRPWQEGKMIIFDDSYEHEAANLSEKQERVILLLDIWNPQLQKEEIAQVNGMFDKLQEMIKKRKQQS